MKKILLLLVLALISLCNVNAQTISVADPGSAGSSGNVVTGGSTYHAVEAIYLDAEIGASNFIGAGNAIQSIKFACNNTSTGPIPVTIPGYSIYMKNVPAASTTFATGTYSLTGYTLVFTGSLNVQSAGAQYSFLFDASATLTTPFARSTGTNLQILIIRNSGAAATGYSWDCSNGNAVEGSSALTSRRYNNTTAPAENSTSLSTSAFRPAIQLIRPIATDASVASVLSSPSPSCFNTAQSISVNLKNTGTSPISTGVCSVKIDVTGAGTYTSTLSNTGALAANTTEIITFSSIPMSAVGVYDIKIYSQLPGDVNASNDTVSFSITNTGVYTTYPVSTGAELSNPLVFQYLKTLSGNNHWSLNSSLTTSATGAFKNADLTDSIYPHSGTGFYVYDNWSGSNSSGHRGLLYAGCFSFSAPASLSFWMTNDASLSTSEDSIYVVYSEDKGQTWIRVAGAGFGRYNAAASTPVWVNKTVNLSSYVGQTIQIGFEGVSKWGNVIGLDDIVVTTPCFAMPTAGTATSSKVNVCSGENFTLNLTGNSSGSGQTYQWQQSSTGSAPWTNVGSATNSTSFSTNQTSSYYYRCEVTCTNSGLTDYSSSVQVSIPALINGTFTIDKNGGGNFTSFADAINYIKCGINGAVIFNIAPGSGPYNEQVTFPQIGGSSSTNTITINGNGETLTFGGGTASNPNTLSLDGADYFRINYLNIEATGGTYGMAAHLYNAADNNKFSNCTFTSSITGTATTQAAFVISGAAATVATAGNSGNSNIVDSCTMVGGYYSAVIYGNSTTPYTVDNQITNSTARDFYMYGIYNVYGRNTIIRHNIVERVNRTNPSTAYAIYLATNSYNCTVDRNRVRKLFDGNLTSTSVAYCLYNKASAAAGFENKWTNNLVSDIRSNGSIYGMYCLGYNYIQIYHNTISLDDASSTSTSNTYGIHAYGNPLDIKNNIVTITRGGTGAKSCLYLSTSTTTTSDNNVLYINAGAGTNYVAYRTSTYATLGAWQTATNLDMHSVSINPQYSNPAVGNYLFTEGSINDIGTPVGVLKDIIGLDRSVATPDPGAYETPPVAGLDISPQLIVSPTTVATGCYTNAETITVRIRNNSINPIDFSVNPVTITVNVTGATTATYSTTVTLGTLASTATNDFTVSVPSPFINMTTVGTYNFEVIAQVAGDIDISNDTLTKSFTKIALTAGATKATPDSYCVTGGKPTLSLIGATGYNSIQWQESNTSNSGYTDIAGGTTLPYTVGSNITQTRYYQAILSCGTDNATSTEDTVTLNNPQISTTTPATRCGPGTVTLNATGTGSEIKWYANPSGGTPLATGNSYTPNVNTTTTYYAAATNNGIVKTIPGDGAWNHITAMGSYQYASSYMILTVFQPLTLISMDIYPSAAIGTPFSIEARTGSASGTTFLSYSGTITVQYSDAPTVAQTLPVNWVLPPGTYYIVFSSAIFTWRSGPVEHALPWTEPGLASIDFALTPNFQYYFYNLKLSTVCESGRTAVAATVNTLPVIDVSTSGPLNICAGDSSTLNVTSGNAGYTYTWTPGNMNGTGVVVNPGSTTKYVVNAVNASGGPNDGCTVKDSVTVTINQPTLTTITPDYAFSCSGGGTKLDVWVDKIIGEQLNTSGPQSTAPNVFQYYYEGNKQQSIVLKSELNALGISGSTIISKIAFEMDTANFRNFSNVIMKMGHTTSSAYSSTTDWKTGLTTVYTAATHTITSGGWQTLTFSTPFVWNGTDNIVIEFIQATGVWKNNTKNSSKFSNTAFNSTLFYWEDGLNQAGFEAYSGTASSLSMARQNMQLGFSADGLNPVWTPLTGLYNDQGLSSPYTGIPAATVYAAPGGNTTYSVQGNDGLCNTNTLNRNVLAYSAGTWNGSVSNDWSNAANWCGGVPTSSTDIVIPFEAPNMPHISSGNQEGASITFNSGTNLSFMTGSSLKVNNLTSNGAIISGSGGKLNVSDVLTLNSGVLSIVDNNVVLQSTATKTARIAPVTSGVITGNVVIERYIPAKATRKWSLLSSPITQTLANSWQQQIHLTGAGTGGTVCPSLTAHTNGFDATATNAPSAYTYDASQAQGSRWQAVSNTNATNVGQGKAFRVNVRGPRSLGCDLLNGVNMVPSAATLSATGTLSISDKNFGPFSITYPNNVSDNWVLIGNPYPSAISFSALQGDNGFKIANTYAIYIPGNLAGTYTYWDGTHGNFIGGGQDGNFIHAKGNIIASGQAVFVQSSGSGDVTLDFKESQKDADGTAGYFRPSTINEKVKVSYGTTDKKIDEVVIRYTNDATVSNTTIGEMDITSMNYGTYITSLKGNQPMVVQTRALNTLSTDEVWINIGATQSGNYTFNFSDYENFAGTEIYLVDHLAKTTQNIKQNPMYMFSVDVNNAATKGSERFSLVFNRNVQPSVVYNTIKMYPNPANKQVTFLLPQSADISYNIKVTDMAGKIVLQHKAAGGTEQMSIDKLTTGTYIVEIIDSKGSRATEKLIKN